jgi:hypothetical protein
LSPFVLLLSLPTLYWTQGLETAPAVKQAGIEALAVPPDRAEAWRKAGFAVTPLGPDALSAREKLHTPGLAVDMNVASATLDPWVFANGWRFLRRNGGSYVYERLPAGTAVLAGAEAFANGADAVLPIDPADLEEVGRLWAFLREVPPLDLPAIADIGVVDDGSPLVGEVMNLLARRNLLFRPVSAPQPELPVNVKVGTKEYPKEEAADPSAFAKKVRRQLGDEKRSLRVFGSNVVLCRLTGDAARVRLHVLNYGRRQLDSVRVRLRGAYGPGEARVAGRGRVPLADQAQSEGATEISLPRMGVYAIVDLPAVK